MWTPIDFNKTIKTHTWLGFCESILQPHGHYRVTCLTVPITLPVGLCWASLAASSAFSCVWAPPAAACCPTGSPMTVPRGSADPSDSVHGRGRPAPSPPPLCALCTDGSAAAQPPSLTDGRGAAPWIAEAEARSEVVFGGTGTSSVSCIICDTARARGNKPDDCSDMSWKEHR